MKNVHLVCNAHLDPVWLWRWQEGCAEALSTFRTAADLIEEYDGFVFCHNESMLYEWVRELDGALWERIRRLVREGRWRVIGGWYLQPDCVMPTGESFVRNIMAGRAFFSEELGQRPTTAINFDSFGHSRGLVQLYRQAGYDSYLVCRPAAEWYEFPNQDFWWEGLDGSRILVHRSDENYNSVYGQVADELTRFLEEKRDEPVTLFLWGVGDHGGGPSRVDLTALTAKMKQLGDAELRHSSPEAYFAELRALAPELPTVRTGLNPVAPGCYTSQVRVKQKHRLLESELYTAERMCLAAALQRGEPYPADALREATRDLLFSEFHDALPGSGCQNVEEDTLRLLDHGLETLSRVKLRAFLALGRGEQPVQPDTSVALVYNPHPFPVEGVLSFECGLPKQNWASTFLTPRVSVDGAPIPTQSEMEDSHFCIDWRKRVTVRYELPPMRMTRMEIRFEPLERRPVYEPIAQLERYVFDNGTLRAVLDPGTGLMDSLTVNGRELLCPGAFSLCALDDTYNSWGFGKKESHALRRFALLTPHEASAFSGLGDQVAEPVRVIEDGEVRTVIEALYGLHDSYAYVRYLLPKQGAAFDIEVGVYWNEKDMALKLELPTTLGDGDFRVQIPFGWENPRLGEEDVMQKWCALADGTHALAVCNAGTHGVSCRDGKLGLTLLRSPGHSAADGHYEKTLHEIRHTPRMEQGERVFRFRVLCGEREAVLGATDRAAQALNEAPYALACNPAGVGGRVETLFTIDAPNVALSALKRSEDGQATILRLYECRGEQTVAHVRFQGMEAELAFQPFEIRTYRVDGDGFADCPLLENF